MGIIEQMQAEIKELRTKVELIDYKLKSAGKAPVGRPAEVRKPTRDEIVEKAKVDVAELAFSKWDSSDEPLYIAPNRKGTYLKTIVNRDKRTVVALLIGKSSQKVHAKGIAKCDPSDCFNSHIGKAIALRRALGIEVPAEYLNATHPTEVKVGDVIESRILKEPRILTIVADDRFVGKGTCALTSLSAKNGKIIDDSREGVGA